MLPKKAVRGRKRQRDQAGGSEADDAAHAVLGGLRGGYRISGDRDDASEGTGDSAGDDKINDVRVTNFDVPQDDKTVVCQQGQRKPPTNSEELSTKKAIPRLIFTHGAGGGLANPATVHFATGFAGAAAPVVCFQGTMNLKSRIRSFETVISWLAGSVEHGSFNGQTTLGGRSMGARAAVLAANADQESRFKTLVLVSYPLLGGKGGTDFRDQILYDIAADTDVLFVTGTSDKMCPIDGLRDVRQKMRAHSWVLEVQGADHSMAAKPKQAVENLRKKSGEIAAQWTLGRDRQFRECSLSWDATLENAVADAWQTTSAPSQEDTQREGHGRKREAPISPTVQPTKRQQQRKSARRAGGG